MKLIIVCFRVAAIYKQLIMNKTFTINAIIISFLLSQALFGINPDNAKKSPISGTIVLPWIKNAGQYDNKIAYATKTGVADIAVFKNGDICYFLISNEGEKTFFTETLMNKKTTSRKISGKNISPTKFNFIKSGKGINISGIASYNTLDYGEISEGLNLNINIRGNNIEKVITIQPYANPALLQFQLKGVEDIYENEKGELQLEIKNNTISFTKPVAWQIINGEKVEIDVKYNIKTGFVYGFSLGKYDNRYNLYIDPLLSASFIGGSQFDVVSKVVAGQNNLVYVGGMTGSPDFSVTNDVYDNTFNGDYDIFIAAFNSNLSGLEICTFIGGSAIDELTDMKLDTGGDIYFTGRTESKDYPYTTNAFDTIFNGAMTLADGDMIISCLSGKLDELKYSTFVGGDMDDAAIAFDFDDSGNLIVTGISESGILSVGPQFYTGTKEFVFFKINSNLSDILASNSVQTDSITVPFDLVTEGSQSVFIAGTTNDSSFPVTTGAYSEVLTGETDIFIIKLSNDLSTMEASTFLGGKKNEAPGSIILDGLGNVYLSGQTSSPSFPVTSGAYDIIFSAMDNIIDEDAFLCIMDNELDELNASTFLGGSNIDVAGELILDTDNNVYLSGFTYSEDFPVFCNSFDDTYNGEADCFLVKFSPKLEKLIKSTYYGGENNDFCYSIDSDALGNIYTAGFTGSADFPVYAGFDTLFNGNTGDGFVLKITPDFEKPYPCCSELLQPVPFSTNQPMDINIVWSQARGATGYYFSAGTLDDTFNIAYHLDMQSDTSYFLQGLSCGDTVYVKISPYNDYGINKKCETYWFTTREPFYKQEDVSICEGDSVEWQGNYYNDNGVYFKNFTDIYGCDSTYALVLQVNPNFYTFEEKDICEGDSYFWQGENIAVAGTYTKNYSSIEGCDSIFELKLNIYPSYEFSEQTTLCKGDSFLWQGYTLTSGGTYTAEYETINGCDSTYILDVALLASYEFYDTAFICEGDYYDWQGQSYTFPGNFQKAYSTVEGCDSIYHLNLNLYPNYHFSEEILICTGDTLLWQGLIIDSAGIYNANYTSVSGCDSTYQAIVTTLPSYDFNEDAAICDGDTLTWQGMTIDSAGVYIVVYNTVEGCDSTYQITVSIAPEYHFNEDTILCSGDTLFWQGMEIDSAGTYNAVYNTVAGCDSTYQITVSIASGYFFSEDTVICEGDILIWQGTTIDSAGIYNAVYSTIAGCDSTYQINVSTLPSYHFEESNQICEGDTLEWQGRTIDSSGTYYAEYQTIMGCDSIYKIEVEEVIIDNSITQSGDTLFAVYDSTASYQWITCPDTNIQGANDYFYVTTESGNYAVIINKGDCEESSECIYVVNSGIEKIENQEIRIYPNPVSYRYLTVSIDDFGNAKTIKLCNLSGKILKTINDVGMVNKIDVENLVSGVYFVRIYTGTNIINKKVIIVNE